MEPIDCVVIGAGVIGLAIARALSGSGREVLIIDQGATFGTETSSRNSEVIHAGIYYAPGSLMATLCVAGRKALYAYCESRNIAYRRCGKLIVATTPEEVQRLDDNCTSRQRQWRGRSYCLDERRGNRFGASPVLRRGAALALDRDH